MAERVDNVANKVFTRGEKLTSADLTLDDDNEEITISIDRPLLPVHNTSDVCHVQLYVNFGGDWVKYGACSLTGGTHIGRRGQEIMFSHFTVQVPKVAKRKLRVVITAKEQGRYKVDVDQLLLKKPVTPPIKKAVGRI